jgi:U3 small nucleolar RNA-associated protein 10
LSITAQCRFVKQTNTESIAALLSFVSKATTIIAQSSNESEKYTAISCVDHIATKFGKKDTTKIMSAAEEIASEHALGSSNLRVQIASLLTLSSIIEVLKDEMLPIVPNILEASFTLLQSTLNSVSPNDQLKSACFTLIISTAEHLPFILSADKLDTAIKLTQSSVDGPVANADLQQKFYATIARKISAMEIFSAIQRNYDLVREQGLDQLVLYYNLAKSAIESHAKSDAIKNATVLFRFLTDAFELRSLVETNGAELKVSAMEAGDLELAVIEILLSLVLKINDATFRPFFIRLVEWASLKVTKNHKEHVARSISLFQFMKALIHRLKVLPYLHYI